MSGARHYIIAVLLIFSAPAAHAAWGDALNDPKPIPTRSPTPRPTATTTPGTGFEDVQQRIDLIRTQLTEMESRIPGLIRTGGSDEARASRLADLKTLVTLSTELNGIIGQLNALEAEVTGRTASNPLEKEAKLKQIAELKKKAQELIKKIQDKQNEIQKAEDAAGPPPKKEDPMKPFMDKLKQMLKDAASAVGGGGGGGGASAPAAASAGGASAGASKGVPGNPSMAFTAPTAQEGPDISFIGRWLESYSRMKGSPVAKDVTSPTPPSPPPTKLDPPPPPTDQSNLAARAKGKSSLLNSLPPNVSEMPH